MQDLPKLVVGIMSFTVVCNVLWVILVLLGALKHKNTSSSTKLLQNFFSIIPDYKVELTQPLVIYQILSILVYAITALFMALTASGQFFNTPEKCKVIGNIIPICYHAMYLVFFQLLIERAKTTSVASDKDKMILKWLRPALFVYFACMVVVSELLASTAFVSNSQYIICVSLVPIQLIPVSLVVDLGTTLLLFVMFCRPVLSLLKFFSTTEAKAVSHSGKEATTQDSLRQVILRNFASFLLMLLGSSLTVLIHAMIANNKDDAKMVLILHALLGIPTVFLYSGMILMTLKSWGAPTMSCIQSQTRRASSHVAVTKDYPDTVIASI